MQIEKIDGIGTATAEKLNTLGIQSTDDIKNIDDILTIKNLGVNQIHNILKAKGTPLSVQQIEFLRSQKMVTQIQKTKLARPKKTIKSQVKIVTKSKFTPSIYQQAIYDTVDDDYNIVVEALAGSGKTTTVVDFIEYIPEDKSVLFLAFNKHIEQELREKAPSRVDIRTVHGFGKDIVFFNLGMKDIKPDKIFVIMEKYLTMPVVQKNINDLKYPVRKAVDMLKFLVLKPTPDNIDFVIKKYSMELPDCVNDTVDYDVYLKIIAATYNASLSDISEIDYADMLMVPIHRNLIGKQYDYVLVDEAQDNSKAQQEIVARALKPNGKLIAIGDSKQAINAFAGADSDSLNNYRARFNCKDFELPITYRCPTSHVDLVRPHVPQIQTPSNAKIGKIIEIDDDELIGLAQENDLILCRNNAPLVRPCLRLIAQGKKAKIKSRDFDKELINMINKFKPKSLGELQSKLDKWYNKQKDKMKKNGIKNTQVIDDKYECISTLIDISGATTVQGVKDYIKKIFSDSKAEITLSSVHRAKGLEAENVFIVYPFLMPSKKAEKDWEIEQEENVKYVAYTRSKDTIYEVSPSK